MNARGLRRFLDDLLRGRRNRGFDPDDFEAAQMRTAIDLQAARPGADAPRPEFLTDLNRRLAAQLDDGAPDASPPPTWLQANRRQVIVGTSAAATAAVAAVSVDRVLGADKEIEKAHATQELKPTDGSWQRVAATADVPDGAMQPFDLGSVVGFVRRVDGRAEGVSGICTHQGCRLWFDAADDRLRCPCHATSFSKDGQVLTHQLPVAPKSLLQLEVREMDGAIEVFAPPSRTQPS